MQLVEVHNRKTGEPIYLNPAHVASISEGPSGATMIVAPNNASVEVKESLKDTVDAVNKGLQ